jgi:ABC-type nickel/cobalt efflux system permease component RcnA
MTFKTNLIFLISLFLLLIPFSYAHAGHSTPASNIFIETENNKLKLEILTPIFCKDSQCNSFDYFNYSFHNFNNNLTIIQENERCDLIESSFFKKIDLNYSIERYNITYTCPSNIDSLNITNTLFYEKTGYYFEQYYVINCTDSMKVLYSHLSLPEVEFDYFKICEINKTESSADIANIHKNGKQSIDSTSTLFNKVIDLSKQKKFFILFLLFSFFLGILHSFSPGHGKSLIVSYIIGKKVSKKDILKLSLTTATTHVLDVLLLSTIFLFLPMSLKDEYMKYISLAAALLIIAFGVHFFIKNIRKKKAHSHHHSHSHSHRHTHHHKTSKKSLISIGILAGLAPCPTGWLLFSILISLNLYYQAVFSLLFFSLGLISTILIISVLFIHFKKAFNFIPEEFKGYNVLKLISSILIIFIGIIMLLRIII